VRLIQKWLNAGVLEDGEWRRSEEGTPQGGAISPLLANIYLHYVFDLWVHDWRRQANGDVIVVRYCDDFIVGFQHESKARQFLKELRERFAAYGLELHPEKTRLIEFGRYASENRDRDGRGKPETFDFLGFTSLPAQPERPCGVAANVSYCARSPTLRSHRASLAGAASCPLTRGKSPVR
jgi:hypothetical protein